MNKGFTIEFIKEDDADEVLEHMRKFYFKVSSTSEYLNFYI